jgi:hypothetical protein
MFTCLCNRKGTNYKQLIGWALNSKNPTTNAYAIVKVLSLFSSWEGRKSPYMLPWRFEKGESAKMDAMFTPHM